MRYTSVCVSAAIATFGIATISAAADDALFYNGRGNAYMYKHDYDRAIADFEQAIRLDPKFAKAYNGRGATYFRKGDYDRAMSDYDRAIRLDPKYAVTYVNRGYVYEQKSNYRRAIADYDHALKLDPNNAFARLNRERVLALLAGKQTGSAPAEQRSLSEQALKALREKIRVHWKPDPSISSQPDQYRVAIRLHLNRDGRLSAPMEVRSKGTAPLYQSAVEAAKRAIELSQPFDMLSPSTYDLWETVEINFDPGTFSIFGSIFGPR
jgi:tetratricopeptide (TPR) repeat protein